MYTLRAYDMYIIGSIFLGSYCTHSGKFYLASEVLYFYITAKECHRVRAVSKMLHEKITTLRVF